MDRNGFCDLEPIRNAEVALRKESVDRNIKGSPYLQIGRQSLSARRAWIEMLKASKNGASGQSLSARRAWIEMIVGPWYQLKRVLSLSARRAWIEMYYVKAKGDLNS